MDEAVLGTDLVAERVDVTGGLHVQRLTAAVCCGAEILTGNEVFAVGHDCFDVVLDEADALDGPFIAAGVVAVGDITFDTVRNSVDGSDSGDAGRKAGGQGRVEEDGTGSHGDVRNGVLLVGSVVGDDRSDGGFSAGTGRGRDGNDVRDSGVGQRETDREIAHQAAHLFDGLFRFGNTAGDCFAGVHGRAAAETDEGVTALFLVHRECCFHVFDGRVRFDTVIDGVRETGVVHALQHRVEDAELVQGLIGDDEGLLAAVSFQDLSDTGRGLRALDDVLRRDQERERDVHQAAGKNADTLFDVTANFAVVCDLQDCIFKSHSFVVPLFFII